LPKPHSAKSVTSAPSLIVSMLFMVGSARV
jgi:hypothetical protein